MDEERERVAQALHRSVIQRSIHGFGLWPRVPGNFRGGGVGLHCSHERGVSTPISPSIEIRHTAWVVTRVGCRLRGVSGAPNA
jgi:hypothetical protein